MPITMDPDSFGFLITDISRLMRAEMDRRITKLGLGITPGEARTLAHAARVGPARQMVLAERMGVEAMTLSSFLDKLEARGLIERVTDPADRRAKIVHLTEAAADVLAHIGDVGSKMRAEIAHDIAPEIWDELRVTLMQVRDTLTSMRPECQKASAAA